MYNFGNFIDMIPVAPSILKSYKDYQMHLDLLQETMCNIRQKMKEYKENYINIISITQQINLRSYIEDYLGTLAGKRIRGMGCQLTIEVALF